MARRKQKRGKVVGKKNAPPNHRSPASKENVSKSKLREKNENASKASPQRRLVIVGMVVLGLIGLAFAIKPMLIEKTSPSLQSKKAASQVRYKPGTAYYCRLIPPFVRLSGLSHPVAIDTRQTTGNGPVLLEFGGKQKSWQHPSWKTIGTVGPVVMDAIGNMYVIPIPSVSLDINPPLEQNKLYVVGAENAEMRLLMALPFDEPPSASNPFGLTGLSYDCGTRKLYVSSVAGSSADNVRGNIRIIDPRTKEILGALPNIDALALAVFNFKHEKRLYYGDARSSNIFSVALDRSGMFIGSPRFEFSLAALKQGDTTSAKKIRFLKKGKDFYMRVDEVEFAFRLTADQRKAIKAYLFKLNKSTQKWVFDSLAQ